MSRRILPLLLLLFSTAAFASSADVTALILASPTADANAPFGWKIDVINNGPNIAQNVVVSGSTVPPLQTTCYPAGVAIIYPDSHAVVECSTVTPSFVGSITLRAHAGYLDDPQPGNNDPSRTIQTIAGPNLDVFIGSPKIDPGLPFAFSLYFENFSAIDAPNSTLKVTLPAGVTATHLPDNCSEAGGVIQCSLGTVPAKKFYNGTSDLIFTAVAADSTNGTIINLVADITAGVPEGLIENNHSTFATQVYRTFFVTDAADQLASAIDQANAACTDEYPCKIAFRLDGVPPNGYFTIRPVRRLPAITAYSISIDGTTQTRRSGDTNPNGPEIFIDGSNSSYEDALFFRQPCVSELAGVSIGNFTNAAVTMSAPASREGLACAFNGINTRTIHDNFLGVDPTGTHAAPNGRGIVFDDTFFPAINVTNNVISANHHSGIWMGRAFRTEIKGNRIGLDIHNQPLGNGASGIFAGPLTSDVDIRGNYIAFNHDFGIAVDKRSFATDIGPNSIYANLQIGIDVGLDGPTPDSGVPAPDVLSAHYDPATDSTVVVVATQERKFILGPTLTLYASDAPHRSGYGDAQYLIGIVPFFDPANGNITFAAKGDWRGKWVSGTITRNNFFGFLQAGPGPEAEFPDTHSTTSELSRAVKVE